MMAADYFNRRFAAHSAPERMACKRQRGGAAIEFVFTFPIFFTLFYAISSYALVFTLEQALTLATKEGARAAIKVDPTGFADNDAYLAQVTGVSRAAVVQSLSWLTSSQQAATLGSSPNYDKIAVTLNGAWINISVSYPYSTVPLMPVLTFPGIGKVPNVPDPLTVTAQAQI
ncbi:TadE/TadG family type IV pilus assembly protein [Methylomonas rhizoryzae]|uniref:TadE/TadG family type IV pilus assembly protein n=1 Tax=Methylomonas rhizoryzae TaxID=2608981 RepID=UPI0012324462|nr:TadE/TadG family type IV pilus assembly protein [Methylomonas rhizoryzae]